VNASELSRWIGRTGLVPMGSGLYASVRVLDARSAYGRVLILVVPIAGEGEAWIQADRFKEAITLGGASPGPRAG